MKNLIKVALLAASLAISPVYAESCMSQAGEYHPLTYRGLQSNPGDKITVLGTEYTIVRFAFKEFETNQMWYVQYPVESSSYKRFDWSHVKTFDCNGIRIDGEIVRIKISTGDWIFFNYIDRPEFPPVKSYLTYYASAYVRINIRQTELYINFTIDKQVLNYYEHVNNYDFTVLSDDYDVHQQEVLDALDTLYSYIQLGKID